MKTISSEMRTHLDGPVTSLCSIWKITRTDGTIYRFTDHDQDVTFGGYTYLASSGYRRSGAKKASDLSVDNLEILGVFSSSAISRSDMEVGKFDHAEVRLSTINWADPSMGEIKIHRGWLGEVVLSEKGMFRAELRGMTQILSQNILTKYQEECRADFGDSKCKYPVYPAVLGRNQEVVLGEHYRVPTGSTSGLTWPNLCPNPGFELDAAGEVVSEVTGWEIVSGSWDLIGPAGREGLLPKSGGERYLCGSNESGILRFTVSVEDTGVDLAHVDAGDVTVDLAVWRANALGQDTGRVHLQALDEDLAALSSLYDSGDEIISPDDTWTSRGDTAMVLPTTTRYLRLTLTATKVFGTYADVGFDDVALSMTDSVATNTYQEIYENRIYEVTTAGTTAGSQPSYSTTIGVSTTDGTAVLKCEDAVMRHGWVRAIISSRRFEIDLDGSYPADGWFNEGGIVFETGTNAGKTYEIKSWLQTEQLLTLYLELLDAPLTGDRVRLYRGCDKKFDSCIDNFDNVLNFRGDPFIPGSDTLAFRPANGSAVGYRTTKWRRPA